MIKLTKKYVDAAAPNANAATRGWYLVRQGSFIRYFLSKDETLIFGECQGSGSSNYFPSVDFVKPESPVYRCACPSRQIPCKHCLALMYAFASGKSFSKANIPEDILLKRAKLEKRSQRQKKSATPKEKKVNKAALKKKIKAQLEGLSLLSDITGNIIRNGFAAIDPPTLRILEDQVKELGNYYLPGAQTALNDFLLLLGGDDRERIYSGALIHITTLHSLAKKGSEYLDKRLQDPDLKMDPKSTIDEWLGHAMQLSELKEMGLVQQDVELIQLAFNSYTDDARMEYVDLGEWINLETGQLQETKNYRPFRAAQHIREDDSFFSVVCVKELYTYPGDMNPRVRWEEKLARDITGDDYKKILSFANPSLAGVVKDVKNQLKRPLSHKTPVALLNFSRIGELQAEGKHKYMVMEDSKGHRLVLEDKPGEPATCRTFRVLPERYLNNQALLVKFFHNMDNGNLRGYPLSIVTEQKIVRLGY